MPWKDFFTPTKRLVAYNTASQFMGKALGASTALIVNFLVAREFGVAGYGEFTKITAYVAPFFLVVDFGLNAIFLQKNLSFKSLLGLRISGGLILVFLCLGLLALLPQGAGQGYTSLVRLGIFLFSPAILFHGLITTANAIFQKKLRYDLATAAIAVGSAATIITLWFGRFLSQTLGPVASVWAIGLGSAVTAVAALLGVRLLKGSLVISFNSREMLGLLLPGIPLGLTLIFNLIYFHADSVILALTRPTSEVGIYGLAFKAFEVPLVFPTFFMNAVYPLMLKVKGEKFFGLFKKSLIILLLFSFFFLLLLWFASPLVLLIREDFMASIPALRVLSLGLPFFFVSALVMWALITLGKQTSLAFIYGLAMFLNIFFNILFIPQYGYLAAAWITVCSEGIVLLMSGYILGKNLKFKD